MSSFLHCIAILALNYGLVFCLERIHMDSICEEPNSMGVLQGQVTYDVKRTPGASNKQMGCQNQVLGSSDRIMFVIDHLDLPCDLGNITFYDDDTYLSEYITGLSNLCGSRPPEGIFASSGWSFTVVYTENIPANKRDVMRINFTSFHDGRCTNSDFECSNGRCVFNGLSCTDNPCFDNMDCKQEKGQIAAIVVISVVTVVVVIIVAVAVICMRRKKRFFAKDEDTTMRPYAMPTFTPGLEAPSADQPETSTTPPGPPI